MKYIWLYFLISSLVILPGVCSLFKWQVKPSIDFTGGTLLEIKAEKLSQDLVKNNVQDLKLESSQKSGEQTILLRFQELSQEQKDSFLERLKENKIKNLEILRFETLGPSLGRELLIKTGVAIVLAILAILFYVNIQFKDKLFGISAILAMLHDTLILVGSFSLLGHFLGVEVDGLFVTAVLTTLSASVHDTVVVFDRIRELSKIYSKKDIKEISNLAISQTLARSINNSLTIIFMLIALVVFASNNIKWFAVALLIGTTAGTYSSTFVAIPIMVLWKKLADKRK